MLVDNNVTWCSADTKKENELERPFYVVKLSLRSNRPDPDHCWRIHRVHRIRWRIKKSCRCWKIDRASYGTLVFVLSKHSRGPSPSSSPERQLPIQQPWPVRGTAESLLSFRVCHRCQTAPVSEGLCSIPAKAPLRLLFQFFKQNLPPWFLLTTSSARSMR